MLVLQMKRSPRAPQPSSPALQHDPHPPGGLPHTSGSSSETVRCDRETLSHVLRRAVLTETLPSSMKSGNAQIPVPILYQPARPDLELPSCHLLTSAEQVTSMP